MTFLRTWIVMASLAFALVAPMASFSSGSPDDPDPAFTDDDAAFLVDRFNRIIEIYLSQGEPQSMYLGVSDLACDVATYFGQHENLPVLADYVDGDTAGPIQATYEQFEQFLEQQVDLFTEHGMSAAAVEYQRMRLWLQWGFNDEGVGRPENARALSYIEVVREVLCVPLNARRREVVWGIIGTVELVGGLAVVILNGTVWTPVPGELPVAITLGAIFANAGYDRLMPESAR